MDTLYVVMPAYNEEENIRDSVLAWYSVLEGKMKTLLFWQSLWCSC